MPLNQPTQNSPAKYGFQKRAIGAEENVLRVHQLKVIVNTNLDDISHIYLSTLSCTKLNERK